MPARGAAGCSAPSPRGEDGIPLGELAARTGLPESTVHLLLAELTAVGLVERRTDGYRLGLALFERGQRVPHRGLREAAPPFMEELYEATHENVHRAVVDGAVHRLPGEAHRPPFDTDHLPGRRPPSRALHRHRQGAARLRDPARPGRGARCGAAPPHPAHHRRAAAAPAGPRAHPRPRLRRELGGGRGRRVRRRRPVYGPRLGPRHFPVAAVSVTGATRGLRPDRVAPVVCAAALALSHELAGR